MNTKEQLEIASIKLAIIQPAFNDTYPDASKSAYGIPTKLYVDSGSPYKNEQLSLICGSLGIVLLHTPIRDGASKGYVKI